MLISTLTPWTTHAPRSMTSELNKLKTAYGQFSSYAVWGIPVYKNAALIRTAVLLKKVYYERFYLEIS